MATAPQIGDWSDVISWPLIGLHAILTPDRKILSFGTDGAGNQGGFIYDVWDPVTGQHTVLPNFTPTDIFCAMQVIVPETGEILISGGDARPDGHVNEGVHDVNTFDYTTNLLTVSPDGPMNFDRWYPSAVTLGNGQIVLLGGRDHHGDYVGYSELYTPGVGWQVMPDSYIPEYSMGSLYPRTWVNSSGDIICVTPGFERIYAMDPSSLGATTVVGWMPPNQTFSAWMPTIMFAEDKVLLISNEGQAFVMDISGTPTFTAVTPPPGLEGLTMDRAWGNLTLLADGSVLLNGGSGVVNENTDVHYAAATWNPSTNVWSSVDSELVPRLYHSVSILLPDATVLSMGGGAPGPANHLDGQIYKPAYLFNADGSLADRPVITQSPQATLHAGDTFSVSVTSGQAISSLSLVAFGSVTHSTNFPARQFSLDFTQQPDGTYTVHLPDNINSLTPGYWMLFAIDSDGTPSVAATIQVATEGVDYTSELAPIDYGIDFETKGSAFYDVWNGHHSLTPDAVNEAAAVMSAERVDLHQSFTIAFDLYFGDDNAGGDGISFVLHNDPLAECCSIGGGGVIDISLANGLGFDFDTFQNAGDPAADHANFFDAANFQTKPVIGSVATLANLENAQWHAVQVQWNGTNTLSFTLDGVQIGTWTGNIATFLGQSDSAYFGIIGATSGVASNEQMLRFTSIDATLEDGTVVDVTHTPGPDTVDDSFAVVNGVLVPASGGVLDNDGAPVPGQYTAHLVVDAGHGNVTLNPDGSFTYIATGGYTGADFFYYRAYNGSAAGEVARVDLNVSAGAGNLPPTGAPTAVLTAGTEDTAYTVAAASLLQGFSDPNGDPLAVGALSASNGSVVNNGNGTYTITPTANFNGTVTLTYTVTDGHGGNLTGQTRAYTLAAVNDTPVITSNGGGTTAAVSIAENTALATTVTSADPDAGQARTYTIVGGTDRDRFAISAATGALTFVSGPDFEAPADANGDNIYDVVVQVADSAGAIDTQGLTITVTNVNGIAPPASDAATITGTSEDDILAGLAGNNTLQGLGGNDSLTGNGGDDTLNGDTGNDVLSGGAGADRLTGGDGIDTLNGGADNDIFNAGAGADSVNTGAANDNLRDSIRFSYAADFGDKVVNFDATGTSSQVDRVQFSLALNTALDDGREDDNFIFATGNGASGTVSAAVNQTTSGVEALLLTGANGEGVTTANLTSASAVAAAFNAEFVITASNGEDALLVVNDTNANSFAVWQWIQAGGGETSAAELTLVGLFTANGTVTSVNFDFV
ncbi:MAG: cadherin-like domain-containing protein [Hyphomicrobiaceae bacterium]